MLTSIGVFTNISSFNDRNHPARLIQPSSPISQIKQPRYRKVRDLVQDHTNHTWQSEAQPCSVYILTLYTMAMNMQGNRDLERKFWLREWMAPQSLESGIELACVPSPPTSLTGSKNTVCSLGGQGRGDRLSPLVGKRRNEGGRSRSGWRVHRVA